MMRRNLVLVGCLWTVALVGCGRSPQTADSLVQPNSSNSSDELADAESLERLGDAAVGARNYEQAISFYEDAVELSPPRTNELLDKIGRQWMSLGRPFEAMRIVESIVERSPDDSAKRADLAGLQAALGLEYRAAEHLKYLVQHQKAGINELIMLTDLTRPQTDKAMCEFALKHYPSDSRPKYSLARILTYEGKWADVVSDLKQVCDQNPDFKEHGLTTDARSSKLTIILQFRSWSTKLPHGSRQKRAIGSQRESGPEDLAISKRQQTRFLEPRR